MLRQANSFFPYSDSIFFKSALLTLHYSSLSSNDLVGDLPLSIITEQQKFASSKLMLLHQSLTL